MRGLLFPLTCILVFGIGALLRLQPWREEPVEPTPAGAVAVDVKLPPGLGDAVFAFYDRVDRGGYAEAYDLSFESKWEPRGDNGYAYAGLTPREEFIAALSAEFGQNGVDLNVVAKQIVGATAFRAEERTVTAQPELAALAGLPPGVQVKSLYAVDVTGALGDLCTPWRFDKQLIVAGLANGKWKILLPGGPRPGSTHKTELFTKENPLAGKDVIGVRESQ